MADFCYWRLGKNVDLVVNDDLFDHVQREHDPVSPYFESYVNLITSDMPERQMAVDGFINLTTKAEETIFLNTRHILGALSVKAGNQSLTKIFTTFSGDFLLCQETAEQISRSGQTETLDFDEMNGDAPHIFQIVTNTCPVKIDGERKLSEVFSSNVAHINLRQQTIIIAEGDLGYPLELDNLNVISGRARFKIKENVHGQDSELCPRI